ncbi:MAG: hypothetical protein JWN48_2585 [Myxococcaceae bacterium]|nr:hypothetical protein [Myxococcaceae bacterium]
MRVQPSSLVPYILYLALLAGSALFAAVLPEHALADAQVSARNQLEIGKRSAESGDKLIVAVGLRADVTFGRAKPGQFRLGPAVEFRTANFKTLEAAAGGCILIPTTGETAFGLYGLFGAATRKDAPDGPVAIGTLTWGFRSYAYNEHWYGYGLNLFGSYREHLGSEGLHEITGGIEVDMMFTTLIPIAAIANFIGGGDPYEND